MTFLRNIYFDAYSYRILISACNSMDNRLIGDYGHMVDGQPLVIFDRMTVGCGILIQGWKFYAQVTQSFQQKFLY